MAESVMSQARTPLKKKSNQTNEIAPKSRELVINAGGMSYPRNEAHLSDAEVRNKIRCTGALPCAHCIQGKADCTYDKPYSRGKAPEPKAAPQDEQEKYLEKFGYAPGLAPAQLNSGSKSASRDDPVSAEVIEDGRTLLREFGNLTQMASKISSRRSAAIPHRSAEPTWDVPASEPTWNATASNIDNSDSNSLTLTYGDAPPPNSDTTFFVLPHVEKARRMLATYFEKTSGTFQILHRPQVERDMEDMYMSGMAQSDRLGNGARATVLVAFALSIDPEASGVYDEKSDSGYSFFNLSTSLLNSSTGPRDHVIVSAYLLQSFFLLSRSRPIQAYQILGSAVTIMFGLKLQRKPFSIPDIVTHECNKRAFWGAYALDKYFATALGRPMLIKDEDIDQDLPGDQGHLDAFILQVK